MCATRFLFGALAGAAVLSPALANPAPATVIHYAGNWSNSAILGPSTGAAAATFDTSALPTVALTLDLRGDALGGTLGFPPTTPLNLVGIRNPDSSVTFQPIAGHETYGDVTASLSSAGTLSLVAANMPAWPGTPASGSMGGVISTESISLRWDVQPHTGVFTICRGTAQLVVVPEPVSTAAGAVALGATLIGRRRRK